MDAPAQILIVEDDPDSSLLMELCVNRVFPNANLRKIASVREAKGLLEELHRRVNFDLVLLDGMLLDGTASEAWRYLRKLATPETTVLLISALPENINSPIAEGIPINKVFQKPITPEDLLSV